MADRRRTALRAVGPGDPATPGRRRGPGIAVIAILAYGLLFLAALWFFTTTAPHP
jgi:hypothetical protein